MRASNNHGAWNKEGASIRITIKPPWWQTRGAYLGYALVIAGMLLLARWNILRRERLRQALHVKELESEKLWEVDRIKTQFFTHISHEFRTPLTVILGLTQRMREMMPPLIVPFRSSYFICHSAQWGTTPPLGTANS